MDFTNKVAVVTGASSGIGAETAKLFAELNAKLTIIGRDETRLLEVAKYCEEKSGVKPLSLILDLVAEGSCETVIKRTVETYGRIDILINCAGKVSLSSFYDQTIEPFDEMININLRVPYLLTILAFPHLKSSKGNVVNIGTAESNRFRPGFLPYKISKAGLENFTKHAAPELQVDGVRINTVSPGLTRTNILDNFNVSDNHKPLVYNAFAKMLPNGKIIEPREIATIIGLTASDGFPSVNGSNFLLDGAGHMA